MKQTRMIMGMPVILETVNAEVPDGLFDDVFAYLEYVDRKFSPFKPESELSQLNRGELVLEEASDEMQSIFTLAEQTRVDTNGYFDIRRGNRYDPSGIVKGWAVQRAADMLREAGLNDYYVYAGGDIQVAGRNGRGEDWQVGIQNPFNQDEVIKVLALTDCGVATSGTYVRGSHIYNPRDGGKAPEGNISLTVVGASVYDADRYVTAAFAMGAAGINFIENQPGFEAYSIDPQGIATYTCGFERVVAHA